MISKIVKMEFIIFERRLKAPPTEDIQLKVETTSPNKNFCVHFGGNLSYQQEVKTISQKRRVSSKPNIPLETTYQRDCD